MKPSVYARVAASLAVAVGVFWLAGREGFLVDTLTPTFLAFAIFSILPIMLRTRWSPWEFAAALGIALALWAWDVRFLGYDTRWGVYASFLGLAGLLLLTYRVIWWEGERRRFAIYTLIPAFLFVASEWFASYFLDWTEKAHPKVLDLYLYSFDASLHVQLSFLLGRLFARSMVFTMVSFFVYLGLPIAIGLTFAGCLVRDRKNALPAFLAMLFTGPVGVIFYNLFPALGPVHLFAERFPWHPLTYEQARRLFLEPVALAGFRNAIPSLHATWMYLVCWYARRLSIAERVGAVFFLFFTLCFTLGSGEHYFIDLVVALPFTVFILALTDLVAGRRRSAAVVPLLVGLGTTLAWLVALRFALRMFWISPVLPWVACLLTSAVSLWAGKELQLLEGEPEAIAKTFFVGAVVGEVQE